MRVFCVIAIVMFFESVQAAEPTLTAPRVSQTPNLDGGAGDATWSNSEWLKVSARVEMGPLKGQTTEVMIKAAHDGQNVYILLRWPDSTESKTHKSYAWNDQKSSYESGPDREDVASIAFPLRGEFTGDMLSGEEEVWDVWYWKAARTAPTGYAMDKSHTHSLKTPTGKANRFTNADGQVVWISRPEDAGGSATVFHPAPTEKQATTPLHYEPVVPSGSAADVRCGQRYRDGWWTVEFSRKLRTGHSDDTQFNVPGSSPMAIAVFDHSEHEDHYTTSVIKLHFE